MTMYITPEIDNFTFRCVLPIVATHWSQTLRLERTVAMPHDYDLKCQRPEKPKVNTQLTNMPDKASSRQQTNLLLKAY